MRISDWSSDVCSSHLIDAMHLDPLLRRPGQGIEVHSIDCNRLVDGEDVDWVDLAWGDDSEGGTARISVEVKYGPGALGVLATIIGAKRANIITPRFDTRAQHSHHTMKDRHSIGSGKSVSVR